MATFDEEAIRNYLEDQLLANEEETQVEDLTLGQPVLQAQPQEPVAEQAVQEDEFRSWDSYKENPDFLSLSKEEKANLFGEWKKYAVDYMRATGDLVTSDDAEYTQNYFNQVSELEGFTPAETPGYFEQLIEQGQSGFRSLQSGVAGYGAIIGAADADEAASAIASRNKEESERYTSPELTEYSKKKLGFFGAVKELITNPFDLILPFFAQSLGSNLPALGTSIAAGGVGTAVGGPAVGAAAGLYTGAALGGATDALVSVTQLINEEAQKRGFDATDPQAVASILKDPEFKEYALKYSTARGLTIGATGLASLGLGQILSKPASEIAKAGFKAGAKEVGKQFAVQAVAEPVGETAAQVGAQIATGQEVDVRGREVAEEAIVGLPTAGLEAGVLTYKNLVENNAPTTANEAMREAVTEFRKTELQQTLEGPTTDQSVANFYDSLTIGEKARVLGLAPNAILTEGQGTYENLSEAEKSTVNQAFDGAKATVAPATSAVEQEQKALEEAQKALETPATTEVAPAVETPAVTLPPVTEVTPAEVERKADQVAGLPAPAPEATQPLTEAIEAPLAQVAPATAAAVVEAAPTSAPIPMEEILEGFETTGGYNTELNQLEPDFVSGLGRRLGRPLTENEKQSFVDYFQGKIKFDQLPSLIPVKAAPALAPAPAPKDKLDYYNQRLEDPSLLSGSVTIGGELFVPTGGTRKIGLGPEYKTEQEANQVADQLRGKKGFENLRVRNLQNGRAFDIQWGDQETLNNYEKINAEQGKLPKAEKEKLLPDRWRFLGKALGYKQSEIDAFVASGMPTSAPAPTPTPAVKKLKPTKKQATALAKLGYLPADIEGLDRTQAKDILANQIPKTPAVEAPKEIPQAPAPTGAAPAPVAPAPVVSPAPTAPAQPEAGEAGRPVAPATGEPTGQTSVEEGLKKADEKLSATLEKLGGTLDPDVKLDRQSVAAFFGGAIDAKTEAKVQSLLRIVTLALSNAKTRLAKAQGAGRNLKDTFTGINKVVFTDTRQGGSGVYADPRNPFEAGTLYINPTQLARTLLSEGAVNPADFLASAVEEEILHANHGKAAVRAFVQTFPQAQNPEIYTSPQATLEAFQRFYDAQNAEIENSLTLKQIKEIVGRYARSLGINLDGKTKEQIISEFNIGRPGRLAEEYLRGIIQQRRLGSMTEDQVKAYATRPILRALGALRNWFRDLVGRGVGRQSAKTFVDKYQDAILDILVNSSPIELRAAQEETGTAMPGRILASSIDPFAQEMARQNTQSKSELITKIETELGKDGSWRNSIIKRLQRSFPAVDPAQVESIVYQSVPEALGSYDKTRGAEFPTYLTTIANRKLLREKLNTLRRQSREVVSFQAPGFYNTPVELAAADQAEAEVEADPEATSVEEVEARTVGPAPTTLEQELKIEERVAPVRETAELAAAYNPETGKTNIAEEDQELEELTLADGEQISSLDKQVANERTAYIESQLGEAGRLLADAARALNLTKMETEILAYAADPEGSPLTREQLTDKYGLSNNDFTAVRDDVMNRMREQLKQAGITRTADVLASSIDPTVSEALARGKSTLPKDIAAEINVLVADPFTDAELERQARQFVKDNSPNGDIMHAKRIVDGRPNMPFRDKIAVLGTVGLLLRNRVLALDNEIATKGNSPERAALRKYLGENTREVFTAASELASRAGQDLRSVRTINGMFLPYNWEGQYTGPITDQQRELLRSKEEVLRLRAELAKLKAIIAQGSTDGIYVRPPRGPMEPPGIGIGDRPVADPRPEGENFYQLLALFGDMSPLEGENFTDYLKRLGVSYDDVVSILEGVKAASVSATEISKVIPANLRSLPASEAIRRLVGIDKNFFGKLISLRLKSGGGATQAEVTAGLERKKTNVKERPAELQTVFDFFGSTESTRPTSEAPIEKDTLPPLVRLAKYAADTVTDRVLRSLGVDKAKTPADSFTKLERQVRTLVNAQFRQETNPVQASPEDTRSVEQRLVDAVQRITLAEDVFNQVQASLREELVADDRAREIKSETQLSAKQRADLEDRVNRTFNPNAISSLDSLLRKIIDFKAEARKHMTQRGSSVESLTEVIKQKFEETLTQKQSESLAKFLSARYAKLAEDARSRQLANITRRIGEKANAMPKGKMQQLFELINLGAFDEEKFYNAIAERYDIPEWDPAVAEEIRKRADKIQRLPQGSDQQSTETFLLQAYIADELNKQKKGWEKLGRRLDVAASLWKAGVLSGPPTQIVNLGATHLNVLFELFAEANAYKKAARKKGLDGKFGDFLGSALSAYWDSVGRVGAQQAGDAFATGLTRFRNEKLTELTPLETFKFDPSKTWSWNNYIAAWKIVGRAMAAADTYNSVIANEAKARMAARYAMLTDGLTPTEAKQLEQEIFDRNNAQVKALEEQVNNEEAAGQFGSLAGLDPKSSAYRNEKRKIEAGKRRRLAQLREQMIVRESKLGEAGLESVRNFTQTATFNNQPQGLIGYIGGQIVGSIAGKVPALVPFAAFPRTIANIINAGLNYTPYGYARAYGFSIGNMFGTIRDSGYAFKKPDPGSVEFYKLQTQAFYGSVVTFTLIALALKDMDKDWDDAFFAVTGRGPADAERREQLRASGWTENSVKFGPLRFKHTDFPGLNTIFGSMALLSDMYRYGNLKEADLATLASSVGMSIGNSIFDKQLLSGAKTLFEAFSDRGNAADKAKRVIQSYTGGFLNPGFARWMTKTFAIGPDGMVGVTDYKTLNATTAGFLIGLTPMAVVAGKPQLNRLGEEIREYPWAATSKRFGFIPEVKEHPVFSPLVKAGLFVPGASINLKINDFENGKPVQRKMDREEFYSYSKYNGEYLKRRLSPQRAEALARLAGRNQDLAQKQLEDLARASKDYAKARIEAEIRLKRRRK